MTFDYSPSCLWALLLVLLPARLPAQPAPFAYGAVTPADFALTLTSAEQDAPAVVLGDFGHARIDGSQEKFRVVTTRVRRLLIRRPEGFNWAAVGVELYDDGKGNWERLGRLRGTTYNLVGGRLTRDTLAATAVFDEQTRPRWRTRKFALPQVRVGSIVEYTYTITSDYLYRVPAWEFQLAVPVRWSEFRFTVPLFFNYNMLLQSALPLAVNEHRAGQYAQALSAQAVEAYGLPLRPGDLVRGQGATFSRWVMRDVPPLPAWPFLTAPRDYQARLDIELKSESLPGLPERRYTTTWTRLDELLRTDDQFGRVLRADAFLPPELAAFQAQYPDPAARTAAVYAWVQQHLYYNNRESWWAERPLRKALAAGSGSVAEVNLLLVAALRTVGLPAAPALTSTRAHGRVLEAHPSLDRFNYVLAAVLQPDGSDRLLDATDPLVPCGWLPARLHGAKARVVPDKGPGRWITCAPGQRAVHYTTYELILHPDGRLAGRIHAEHGGHAGVAERRMLRQLLERGYLAWRLEPFGEWETANARLANATELAKPLKFDVDVTRTAPEVAAHGRLVLKLPNDLPEVLQQLLRHPGAPGADLGAPLEWNQQVVLTLPPAYAPATLPEPTVLALPNDAGRFQLTAQQSAPGQVQYSYKLQLRQTAYTAAETAALRELLGQAAALLAAPLELRPISSGAPGGGGR